MSVYLPEGLLDNLGTVVGQRIKAVRDLIGGGGARLFGVATITVPAVPQGSLDHIETVPAVGVVAGQTIMAALAPHEDADENHEQMLDLVTLTARAGTDQITFTASFSAPTSGPIKLIWSVL
jgi:hypothetical protein